MLFIWNKKVRYTKLKNEVFLNGYWKTLWKIVATNIRLRALKFVLLCGNCSHITHFNFEKPILF